ncbi:MULTISPECIES: hypothetical protein [unclassified Clostridium]|uniref:hypothetical protein n=1 Tax=unclassified Clostridium TaxID=2614128 RepID=UPI001A9BAA4B|nr:MULTISPECIES: hypothetical protein [unclassified Clostridium]
MVIFLLIASVFASYKLAEEKGQNKLIWAIITALVGPFVLAIQYLMSYYKNSYSTK